MCMTIHTKDVRVSVSPTDTLTGGRQCVYGHPWMDQGCQTNCVIHGYSDRGEAMLVWLSVDGPGMSV